MRKAAPCIVIVVLLAAGAAAWPSYDRPNALQGGVQQLGLAALILCFGLSARGDRREKTPSLVAEKSGPWWLQPEIILAAWGVWAAMSVLWAARPRQGVMGVGFALSNALWALLVAHFLRQNVARASRPRRLFSTKTPPAPETSAWAGRPCYDDDGGGDAPRPLRLGQSNWQLCVAFGGLAGGALAVSVLLAALRGETDWWLATQGHKNVLGCYLLGAVFLAAGGLAVAQGMARGRWAATALLGASGLSALAMLAFSGSKGAVLALAPGGAVFGLCFVAKRARWALLLGATAIAVAMLLAAPRVPGLPDKLFRALDRTEQSTRLFHLESSRRMLAQRPWAGWGAGNFMASFPEFMLPEAALLGWQTMLTLHPHNEPALVATETGLVGLALYLLFVFGVVLRGWDGCDAAPDARSRWPRAACLGGFAAMFGHAQMTVALHFWGPMALWWTLAGLVMASHPPSPLESDRGEGAEPLSHRERGRGEGAETQTDSDAPLNSKNGGPFQPESPSPSPTALTPGPSPEGRGGNGGALSAHAKHRSAQRTPKRTALDRHFRPLAQACALAAALALLVGFTLPGQVAHFLMGKAMRLQAASAGAEELLPLFDRVAGLSRYPPQYLRALAWSGDALREAGRGEEAIAAYERLESAAPGLGPTRYKLGRLYLRRHFRTGSQEDLSRALALLGAYARRMPQSPKAALHYARALLSQSPANAAKAGTGLLVSILTSEMSASHAAYDMLGECYALQGRFALAEEAIGKAAALYREQWEASADEGDARNLAETLVRWARAAAAAGRSAAALERLEEARGLLEGHPDLQRQAEELAEALRQ